MALDSSTKDGAPAGTSQGPHSENTLQLPPSQSSLSVRSDVDDSSTGYITASSSRVSQLDSEPVTALPRLHLESLYSSTPTKHSRLAKSPSSESMSTTTAGGDDGNSSNGTSRANLASLSSVTTFVPSTLDPLDTSSDDDDDTGDNALSDPDRDGSGGSYDTEEFVPDYDFDLRDPHERTAHLHNDNDDAADDSAEYDQTLTVRDAREGDVITVSHSHSTSINTYHNDDSIPHSRAPSHPDDSTPHHDRHHASFPMGLSASWPSMPSLALPPSAVKLQRRRRNLLLRLLKSWEGREQVLHFSHSLVLLLHASLDHPVPQTYRGAMLRPAGTLLALSFPRPVRVALMQRTYTTAEGIDNFRRVILFARWVTSATEAAMEHWQQRQANRKQKARLAESERHELEIRLTGDEPIDKPSDHVEDGFRWLQPPSTVPLDAAAADDNIGEQSLSHAPAAKLGKLTGRGDATAAVGANIAETTPNEKHSTTPRGPRTAATPSSSASSASSVVRTFVRLWTSLWQLSHLEAAAESLSTLGEACETAAVLAGGGMFWRAVGIQRLGLPFLSRRRRQGIERLGIVLSLCSVLLSLLVLRRERRALRSELKSAHRRILRANDKLGWASELAGTTIERDQALSYRKRDPSSSTRSRVKSSETQVGMLGPDLQAAARNLDDQDLDASSSSSLSSSASVGSEAWTVVPDADDGQPYPTATPIHPPHYPHSHAHKHTHSGSGHVKSVDVSALLRSTERSLVRAESDLRNTRRRLQLNFWEKIANWSESVFLGYEAAAPHIDKDGIEGWTGLVASAIRLTALWKQLSWS